MYNPNISEMPASRGEELRRGWRPLVACSFGIGLGLLPLPPYAAGIFATALNGEFGWPRGKILAAIMFTMVALVFLGPAVGRLADRVGARKVAIGSTICLGLSLALTATISANIMSFYAVSACMSVLGLGTLPLTYAKVLTLWFDKARGLALGIALASSGVAGTFFPFYIGTLIEHVGWRGAYIGMACLPLFVALPILLLWLKEPGATMPASATGPVADGVARPEGFSVGQALRSRRFWVSAIAGLALGAGTGGLLPNLLPLLTDSGLTTAKAMQALAVLGLSVTAGRLLSGYMLDRLWAPLVALILAAPAAIGILVLAMPGVGLGSAIAAVGVLGLVSGAEIDLVAYITGRYFGEKHYSELYAIQYAVFGLGAGSSPAIYGTIRDATGSYHAVLFLSAALLGGAIALLMTLGRYPRVAAAGA